MWQSQRQVTDDPPVRELFRSIFLVAQDIAGMCVLFPAYVMHEVETNQSDGDRVGIAFNINFE